MNSIICDKDYLTYEKQREYDRIVLSCIHLIIENASRDKKKRIIIRDVNSNSFPFILSVARAALDASLNLKPYIYIQCKFKDYLPLKKKYPNFKYCIKWTHGPHLTATGKQTLLNLVSEYHNINDEKIFEKICKAFYNN